MDAQHLETRFNIHRLSGHENRHEEDGSDIDCGIKTVRLSAVRGYAVKVIDREKLTEKETISVQREVSILKDCRDVENVVQLVDFFISAKYFFVVADELLRK